MDFYNAPAHPSDRGVVFPGVSFHHRRLWGTFAFYFTFILFTKHHVMQAAFVKKMIEQGFTRDQAETAYETFRETLIAEVTTGDGYARIKGLGSFKRVLKKERTFQNPKDRSQTIVKPAHYDVKFNSDEALEQAMPKPV